MSPPGAQGPRLQDTTPHPFAIWDRDALEVAYEHVQDTQRRSTARMKWLYVKAVAKHCPLWLWVLQRKPMVAKLRSMWYGIVRWSGR